MVASVLCHQIGQAKSGNQCEFHGSMAISYRHGKAFNLQHNLHTSYDRIESKSKSKSVHCVGLSDINHTWVPPAEIIA